MKKFTKIWLIAALCLMAAGLVVVAGGLSILGFDFEKLSTQKMVTNTYVVEDAFTHIRLDVMTADVTFVPAQDGKVSVVCDEDTKIKYSVQVEGNTLEIKTDDQRRWYDHIGIHFRTPTVTLYLPAGEYEDVKINVTTGDVVMPEGFSFQNAEVRLTTGDAEWMTHVVRELSVHGTTGDVTVKDVRCGSLNVKVTTGEVKLTKTSALGMLTVKGVSGDVTLDRVDAGELNIKVTTGDVTGTLCTDKVFDTKAATGTIITPTGQQIVPGQKPSNKCVVETTTGDIRLEIAQ